MPPPAVVVAVMLEVRDCEVAPALAPVASWSAETKEVCVEAAHGQDCWKGEGDQGRRVQHIWRVPGIVRAQCAFMHYSCPCT